MVSNQQKSFLLQFFADDGGLHLANELIEVIACNSSNDRLKRIKVRKKRPNSAEITISKYTDDQFKEHFRITRCTFEILLNVVQRQLKKDMQQPFANVMLDKKLLFTLWLMSKQESFLAVGDRFNIPKSSGHGIFKFVIGEIAKMLPQYVKWPTSEQQEISVRTFKERSGGIPGVVGAVDGCHIPIKQPKRDSYIYYNRKQFHSIVLQGVCDASGRFIDVFIGMPGKMDDTRVFKNSPLYEKLTDKQNPLLSFNRHLLGDSAYPLMINLLTLFRDSGHLREKQNLYNSRLNSIRSVIDRAFGALKCNFRRLNYLDIADIKIGNNIIAAATVLHNFIIDNGDVEYLDCNFNNEPMESIIENVTTENEENIIEYLTTENDESEENIIEIVETENDESVENIIVNVTTENEESEENIIEIVKTENDEHGENVIGNHKSTSNEQKRNAIMNNL